MFAEICGSSSDVISRLIGATAAYDRNTLIVGALAGAAVVLVAVWLISYVGGQVFKLFKGSPYLTCVGLLMAGCGLLWFLVRFSPVPPDSFLTILLVVSLPSLLYFIGARIVTRARFKRGETEWEFSGPT